MPVCVQKIVVRICHYFCPEGLYVKKSAYQLGYVLSSNIMKDCATYLVTKYGFLSHENELCSCCDLVQKGHVFQNYNTS